MSPERRSRHDSHPDCFAVKLHLEEVGARLCQTTQSLSNWESTSGISRQEVRRGTSVIALLNPTAGPGASFKPVVHKEGLVADSLKQFGRFLGSNTVIGMAQKVGLTPPPPPLSVRNLVHLAGRPLQPTNIQLSFSGHPLPPNDVPITQSEISWEDPGAGSLRQATTWEVRLKKVGSPFDFLVIGTSREPHSPINVVLEFNSSYLLIITPSNARGKGPDSPVFEFHTRPSLPLPLPQFVKPVITVSGSGSGLGSVFVVSGSGFSPNSNVRVHVVDDQLNQRDFNQSADGQGKLNGRIGLPCNSGLGLHFSATDGRSDPSDRTGVLFSNTFNTTCP